MDTNIKNKVKEMPRERLIEYGAKSLSNSELIAILLRVGVKNVSVLELANHVISKYENLNMLNEVTVNELSQIHGVGLSKAVSLIAAIELGKRINTPQIKNAYLKNDKDIYELMRQDLQLLTHEEFWVLFLDIKSKLIQKKILSKGNTNQCAIDVKELCKWALKYSCSGIILVHNHPSGDPTPSNEDKEVTINIIKSMKLLNIVVCDHIIIGANSYCSFKKENILKHKSSN